MNKLLFNSGSFCRDLKVKKSGCRTRESIGRSDISVLIEGHTDDDAFTASGPIADNWDLSTKRATTIVTILSENKKINKQNSQRRERRVFTSRSNSTAEGKVKKP
jgi:chemotaxis protein MotB